MSPSTIRKAIGAVKDHTSISLAKVVGTAAPDLDVLIVKATSHDNEPADERYVKEILSMVSSSRAYVIASVVAVSRRLGKTHDWIVALKALILVHRLVNDGNPFFGEEMMHVSRSGTRRVLNMSDFRDDAGSTSWDQSRFVRSFASFLDQKLEIMMYEGKLKLNKVEELGPKKLLERLNLLLLFLSRFLALRPTGVAENCRMVLIALNLPVKESFMLYKDVNDVLKYLLDGFLELEYADSVKAFDAYVDASRMIDELLRFYTWCKEVGVVRKSEFPEAEKINGKLLGTLEGLLKEKGNRQKGMKETKGDETLSDVKPPKENHDIPIVVEAPQIQEAMIDLMDLNDEWVQSPTDDWELALVESASNLSKQTVDLVASFDSLLLDGQGMVSQPVKNSETSGGGSSSVDPFAASLLVPVQIADMEKGQPGLATGGQPGLGEANMQYGMQTHIVLNSFSSFY